MALASRSTLSGRAKVVDGDTLGVGAVWVRLHGVDAPESRQSCVAGGRRWACGERATRALAGRIGGRTVACEERDRDRYGRTVAVCRDGGEDVNAWMVSQGWALAYRRYSRDYVGEETAARDARRGIWRGDFVPPWDWRRGERLAGSRSVPKSGTSAGCRIKGNIGRNGTRSITSPEGSSTNRPGSTLRGASGGSAPRPRRGRRGGGGRGADFALVSRDLNAVNEVKIPDNFRRLHGREEELRTHAEEFIESNPRLALHLLVVGYDEAGGRRWGALALLRPRPRSLHLRVHRPLRASRGLC